MTRTKRITRRIQFQTIFDESEVLSQNTFQNDDSKEALLHTDKVSMPSKEENGEEKDDAKRNRLMQLQVASEENKMCLKKVRAHPRNSLADEKEMSEEEVRNQESEKKLLRVIENWKYDKHTSKLVGVFGEAGLEVLKRVLNCQQKYEVIWLEKAFKYYMDRDGLLFEIASRLVNYVEKRGNERQLLKIAREIWMPKNIRYGETYWQKSIENLNRFVKEAKAIYEVYAFIFVVPISKLQGYPCVFNNLIDLISENLLVVACCQNSRWQTIVDLGVPLHNERSGLEKFREFFDEKTLLDYPNIRKF